jgi:hypothetical protein
MECSKDTCTTVTADSFATLHCDFVGKHLLKCHPPIVVLRLDVRSAVH